MRDIIYNILVKYYARYYSYGLCEAMTDYMADKINEGVYKTHRDIMKYIWMNTSGGDTADMVASEIQAALPHLIKDE